jgi:hypothetical protein
MLQGGEGDKHAGVAPQMPAGGAGRHAVFDHQASRHLDHTTRRMTAWQGSSRQIDVKKLLASRTRVRRGGHQEINGTSGGHMAQSMSWTLAGCVARGPVTASGAGGVVVVPVVRHKGRRWEVVDVHHTLWRVWYVFTRSEHTLLPSAKGQDR